MIESREQRPCDLSKATLPHVLKFDSRSEYALCILFERYIPGWIAVTGETFQIPIVDKRIDFLINNTLLEFHPIMINRELKSSDSLNLFRQMYARANKFEKAQLIKLLSSELTAQYSLRRWQLIQHSEHRGKQFIMCGNEREVYQSVMCRFVERPPSWKQFKQEFSIEISRA